MNFANQFCPVHIHCGFYLLSGFLRDVRGLQRQRLPPGSLVSSAAPPLPGDGLLEGSHVLVLGRKL